jgi:hypothetical protein
MLASADDRGFVDTTNDLINALTTNENETDNTISLDLLENSYNSALNELIDKGYLYEFIDKHQNKVHLIRHWFFHNKWNKKLWTNYVGFLKQVSCEEGEYHLKENHLKERKYDNIKYDNIKYDKINDSYIDNETNETDQEEDTETSSSYSIEDFLKEKGVKDIKELTPEQIEEWKNICINGK